MPDASPPGTARNANRDDPRTYASLDEYVAGASSPLSLQTLVQQWNAAHPGAPVQAHGDWSSSSLPTPNAAALNGCGMHRVLAGVQLLGGGLELIVAAGALLAPEPTGATKVVGTIVLLHGMDTVQASVRNIFSCDRTATLTQSSAQGLAEFAGASPSTAETIGIVTDVGVGLGGSFAVGTLSRFAPSAGRLVHLTTAESAASIRASQTLGLGRSTIYAGPASLAQARGWSILTRTGLLPGQATDVLLLPSQASRSFLVVHPLGPFSIWQRLNGTVFSAGAGMFNLTTGAFTRTGLATNQIILYGIDTGIIATIRGSASAIDTMNR
jgi:hypothetical protein